MFEKEAEEYGLENYRNYDDYPYVLTDEKAITKAFKDGAEFGYKYKENEWHYTKYELPPEDVPLLCMRGGNVYVAWFILGKWKGDKYNDVKKPYAWREVKLPDPGLQMPMQEG